MPFNTWTFLVFFIVVLALYRAIPGWPMRKNLLLAASYVFYSAWNPPYALILLFSTTLDWWLARRIHFSDQPKRRRALLVVSLACNLALLGFFKYGDFLLNNFRHLTALAGVALELPHGGIVLPIGISFYTFASLSYTIDVYRREVPGDHGWRDYALFVSFFPHLVSGPIVRARVLLPQMAQERRVGADRLGWGLALVVLGLFSKVALADAIFAPQVEAAYAAADRIGAAQAWLAVLDFSGQIYCDFSGYSLCAIGLALCFGFAFPDNFRQPYAARGFSDFWQRWHISLSSWLRDYLYVPLGGNRGGTAHTCLNLLLTMLIGGLWHGASWMFVLWGGLHAAWLVLERLLRRDRAAPGGLALSLLTFLLVSLTWIPFRAPDMTSVGHMLAALLRPGDWPAESGAALSLCAMLALLGWQWWLRDSSLEQRFAQLGQLPQAALLGSCLIAMFLCSGGAQRAFIYFQF